MKKWLCDNKFSILFLTIVFVMLTYCSLQAFPINDDLPYSLFYRGTSRVTNIKQIIMNQRSDYLTINGRFFIHCVVQFMLMFNRNLFSFINSLCIIITFVFMEKIFDLYLSTNNLEKKINNVFIYCMITGLFLLIGSLKYMNYWVAGSVNYVWVFTLLIIFIYYYLKCDLKKHKIINCIIFLFFSCIHECSFVFVLFLIIGDFIKNIIEDKKMKNTFMYLLYCIISILGGLFVIKSPGNAVRMAASQGWYNLSIIERFNLSLPVISKNILNLFYIDNLVPTIFLFALCIALFKKGNKVIKTLDIFIILIALISFITGNGWIYFILSILVFVTILIYNYQEKNNYMSVLWLAFYAVVFSMAITPEYGGGRPNYYLYLFMIIYTCIFLNMILNNKIFINIIKIILVLFSIIMIGYEFRIYSYIGSIKHERLSQIEKVKKEKLNILEYKKIDEKYAKYHADANSPSGKDYWAYRYFVYYYGLPDDIEIKLVD